MHWITVQSVATGAGGGDRTEMHLERLVQKLGKRGCGRGNLRIEFRPIVRGTLVSQVEGGVADASGGNMQSQELGCEW
jgi:hypothetical protein